MATEQVAAELRQQGALEAARDPGIPVSADDAQKTLVEESKNAGVSAFSFNPDASPEEKKRQVAAVSTGIWKGNNSVLHLAFITNRALS